MSIDVPVICDNVLVKTGDFVVGNADGVVIVPQDYESDVLKKAFEKLKSENKSIKELRDGSYLRDVFEKYGVL